jgi:hypothetical protein
MDQVDTGESCGRTLPATCVSMRSGSLHAVQHLTQRISSDSAQLRGVFPGTLRADPSAMPPATGAKDLSAYPLASGRAAGGRFSAANPI